MVRLVVHTVGDGCVREVLCYSQLSIHIACAIGRVQAFLSLFGHYCKIAYITMFLLCRIRR